MLRSSVTRPSEVHGGTKAWKTPERFELREGENVLGRGKDAALRIDSLEVSRRHALLTVTEGRVTIEDLGSSNHTYVGGEKIHDTVELKLGAKLKFGRIRARLVSG